MNFEKFENFTRRGFSIYTYIQFDCYKTYWIFRSLKLLFSKFIDVRNCFKYSWHFAHCFTVMGNRILNIWKRIGYILNTCDAQAFECYESAV